MLLLSAKEYSVILPPVALLLTSILLGGLMVSHIPYPSLKQRDFFLTPLTFFGVVLLITLIVMEPPAALFLLLAGYIVYGVVRAFSPVRVHKVVSRFVESRRAH